MSICKPLMLHVKKHRLDPASTLSTLPCRVTSGSAVFSPALLPAVGWRRWLPNALTLLRLIIAAAFFVLIAVGNYKARELLHDQRVAGPITPLRPIWTYLWAAALFGLAALTDALDGPLARRWKVVSRFGRVMDPFADKVLVVGSFIMLAGPRFGVELEDGSFFQVSGIQPWMVVVILGRELLVTSIRAVMEQEGKDASALWSGKAKMIVQALAIPAILVTLGATEVRPGTWGRLLIDSITWTTIIVTVLSGWPYARKGVSEFGGPEQGRDGKTS